MGVGAALVGAHQRPVVCAHAQVVTTKMPPHSADTPRELHLPLGKGVLQRRGWDTEDILNLNVSTYVGKGGGLGKPVGQSW